MDGPRHDPRVHVLSCVCTCVGLHAKSFVSLCLCVGLSVCVCVAATQDRIARRERLEREMDEDGITEEQQRAALRARSVPEAERTHNMAH
jgi:hypothetical protein